MSAKPPPPRPYSWVHIQRRASHMSPLPLTILSRIFVHLPPPSIGAAIRVNSQLYRAGIEQLHNHIWMTEHGPWPSFTDMDRFPPLPLQQMLGRSWLRSVVHTLDVFAHSTRVCMTNPDDMWVTADSLPALPNIKILRIHMTNPFGTSQHQRSFHTNGDQQFHSNSAPHMHVLPQCPAVYRIKPRTLVALGGPIVYREKPITALPYGLLAAVERYVLVLSPDAELLLADKTSAVPILRARAIASDIANVPDATDIVIVFYTPRPHIEWRGAVATMRTESHIKRTWAGRFLTELAHLIAQLPFFQHIKFVNAGSLDKYATAQQVWDPAEGMRALETHFRKQMDAYAQGQGHERGDRIAEWCRTTTVDFVSMEDYLRRTQWKGEFEHAEVAEWLRPKRVWGYL